MQIRTGPALPPAFLHGPSLPRWRHRGAACENEGRSPGSTPHRMPIRTVERAMSGEERDLLERMSRNLPGPTQRLGKAILNAVLLWAVTSLAFLLLWGGLAWAAREIFRSQIGSASTAAAWIVPACAVFAVVSTVRWVRGWSNQRPLLEADVESGRVVEEHYQFVAAKRFQEPEHGGLIYFLHTSDGKVMVFFDHESQDRGVSDEDPLGSSFRPCSELVMVRAPRARFVFEKQFSGETLDAGTPIVLTLDPRDWPDDQEYCDIPWDELHARLAA